MFYCKKGDIFSRRQDRTLQASILIADSTLNYQPEYFQQRAWQSVVSTSRKLKNISSAFLRDKLLSLRDPRGFESLESIISGPEGFDLPSSSSVTYSPWASFFTSKPYSTKETTPLLAKALESVDSIKDDQTADPNQLPFHVKLWLKGQKAVLFNNRSIQCAANIVEAVRPYIS